MYSQIRTTFPAGRFRGNFTQASKHERESSEALNRYEAASDGAINTAERLTSHPGLEDDMATSDHKGAHSALEQVISAQRAKLVSAHAVQRCLYEVLLYADGEDAVMYAEAAHVVATLMEDTVDKLDPMHLRRVMREAERGGIAEPTP